MQKNSAIREGESERERERDRERERERERESKCVLNTFSNHFKFRWTYIGFSLEYDQGKPTQPHVKAAPSAPSDVDSDDVASYGVSRKVGRKPTMSGNTFKRIVEHERERERERERGNVLFSITCSNHFKLLPNSFRLGRR